MINTFLTGLLLLTMIYRSLQIQIVFPSISHFPNFWSITMAHPWALFYLFFVFCVSIFTIRKSCSYSTSISLGRLQIVFGHNIGLGIWWHFKTFEIYINRNVKLTVWEKHFLKKKQQKYYTHTHSHSSSPIHTLFLFQVLTFFLIYIFICLWDLSLYWHFYYIIYFHEYAK